MKNGLFIILNILLAFIMCVHIGAAMYVHSLHPEWSAPAYVEFLNAVYYIIPFALVNLMWIFCRKRLK